MRPWLLCLALLVAVAVVLGVRTPATVPSAAATLGPESGERVSDYLELAGASRSGSGERWALVSLDPPADPAAVAALLPDGVRLSRVLLRVPLDRVQTPLVAVDLADQADRGTEVAAAWSRAAGTLSGGGRGDERAAQVATYSAEELRAGCGCAVGLLVRAEVAVLDSVAAGAGVRAVQAAPGDVGYGGLAVRPLLPEHVEVVRPGPDDGVVPRS